MARRNLRREKKLTQKDIALALNIRLATVSDWERGASMPRLLPSKMKALMEVLDCTIDDLIEFYEKRKRPKPLKNKRQLTLPFEVPEIEQND